MLKKQFYLFLCCISIFSCTAEKQGEKISEPQTSVNEESAKAKTASDLKNFQLKAGDLLFQDSDCGPFCDAIEKVTKGVDGANFSHIGMVVPNQRNQLVVLEAIGKGVVETPIDTFINRSFDDLQNPKVMVGRLKPAHEPLLPIAIQTAKSKLGKDYDEVFDINNDLYYCSELIYLAFKAANNGQPIFQLRPMTFKDPDTEKTFDLWVNYYKELNENIPEGAPGLNPGSISRSFYIEMIHAYGKPSGWRGKI